MTDLEYLYDLLDESISLRNYHREEQINYQKLIAKTRREIKKFKILRSCQ